MHCCQGMEALGKTLTLLWQIFLVAGPGIEAMRLFLRRVRSITTDTGVERLIVNQPDCLQKFYKYLNPNCAGSSCEQQHFLFPRAIKIQGWKHLWDLMVRRGLGSIRNFPAWLSQLKALVQFLRNVNLVKEFADDVQSKGYPAVAEMLKGASFPTVAEWWSTGLKHGSFFYPQESANLFCIEFTQLEYMIL